MIGARRAATRVLIVDDHALFRAGLRSLLAAQADIEVAGEAGDGVEALAAVERLAPDLVLTDLSMPKLDGYELTARLARARPEVRVLVVSMHVGEHQVRRALQAGARGYLAKDCSAGEFCAAVRAVARGARAFAGTALRAWRSAPARTLELPDRPDGPHALTTRQREVLRMVAEGMSTKEIARTLGLSVKTVDTHRAQIVQRLAIRDVAGLVRFAIRHGMVHPDA